MLTIALGSQDAFARQSLTFAEKILGRFQIVVSAPQALYPELPANLRSEVQGMEDVTGLHAVEAYTITVADTKRVSYLPTFRSELMANTMLAPPLPLREGAWLREGSTNEVVISGAMADQWQAKVGELLPVEGGTGEFPLQVVGITDEVVRNQVLSGLFVRPETAAHIVGDIPAKQRLFFELDKGRDAAVLAAIREKIQSVPEVRRPLLLDREQVASEMGIGQLFKRFDKAMLLGALLCLLATALIVASTLSIGISKRMDSLRVLRAIGAGKRHLLGSVMGEALLLGLFGILVGLLVGGLALQGFLSLRPDVFTGIHWPSATSLFIAFLLPLLVTLFAALFPAWRASRLRPFEAQGQSGKAAVSHAPFVGAGLALLTGGLAVRLHRTQPNLMVLSILLILVTAVLATPAVLLFIDAMLQRLLPVSAAFRDLLRGQVTLSWRSYIGSLLLLLLCLSLFYTSQIWGLSMYRPYMPKEKLPTHIVSVLPAGLPQAEDDKPYDWDGVGEGRIVAMNARQTTLAPSMLARRPKVRTPWMLVLAVDPERAFTGTNPPLPPGWAGGDPDEAVRRLKAGELMTSPAILRALDLEIGDALELTDPEDPEQTVSLPIGAVGELNGWHWMSTFTKMRDITGDIFSFVVVSREVGRERFGLDTSRFFALDLAAGKESGDANRFFDKLATSLFYATPRTGTLTEDNPDRQFIRVAEMGPVLARMERIAGASIWAISSIPLLELFFALLGVSAATVASLHARRRFFGMLRSMGATRRTVVRLVTAEMLVVGLAAVALGLATAWALTAVTLQTSQDTFMVGGMMPEIVVPWGSLLLGTFLVLGTLLATVAFTTCRFVREEPGSMITTEE